jgi:HNH endonuclease
MVVVWRSPYPGYPPPSPAPMARPTNSVSGRCSACSLCSVPGLAGSSAVWRAEIDHVVPVSRGGDPDDGINHVTACTACSRRKGSLLNIDLEITSRRREIKARRPFSLVQAAALVLNRPILATSGRDHEKDPHTSSNHRSCGNLSTRRVECGVMCSAPVGAGHRTGLAVRYFTSTRPSCDQCDQCDQSPLCLQ